MRKPSLHQFAFICVGVSWIALVCIGLRIIGTPQKSIKVWWPISIILQQVDPKKRLFVDKIWLQKNKKLVIKEIRRNKIEKIRFCKTLSLISPVLFLTWKQLEILHKISWLWDTLRRKKEIDKNFWIDEFKLDHGESRYLFLWPDNYIQAQKISASQSGATRIELFKAYQANEEKKSPEMHDKQSLSIIGHFYHK